MYVRDINFLVDANYFFGASFCVNFKDRICKKNHRIIANENCNQTNSWTSPWQPDTIRNP